MGSQIKEAMGKVSDAHTFAKGKGMATPQIGIPRAAVVIRPATLGAADVVPLNPEVIEESGHPVSWLGS